MAQKYIANWGFLLQPPTIGGMFHSISKGSFSRLNSEPDFPIGCSVGF